MHHQSLDRWQHNHDFAIDASRGERRTRWVIALTAVVMLVEIIAGMAFGSMALLADGWHMATHVAAFGITLYAYAYARRHRDNPAYSFGTGKVSTLGGFASAVALAVVALFMALESVARLFDPQAIHFNEAIAVAVLGLLVNLVSAVLLHDHHHDHDHGHHHDHNLRAAYLHVLADALTSVLAIAALLAGKLYGWNWLDPVMGIVGALIIARWATGLLRESGAILLDGGVPATTRRAIRATIEADADNEVADLHVWPVSPHHLAAIVTVVTHHPQPPEHYRALLSDVAGLAHVTVEVNRCEGESCFRERQVGR